MGCADFAGATLDPDLESYHRVLSGSSWDVVTAVADSPQRLTSRVKAVCSETISWRTGSKGDDRNPMWGVAVQVRIHHVLCIQVSF